MRKKQLRNKLAGARVGALLSPTNCSVWKLHTRNIARGRADPRGDDGSVAEKKSPHHSASESSFRPLLTLWVKAGKPWCSEPEDPRVSIADVSPQLRRRTSDEMKRSLYGPMASWQETVMQGLRITTHRRDGGLATVQVQQPHALRTGRLDTVSLTMFEKPQASERCSRAAV